MIRKAVYLAPILLCVYGCATPRVKPEAAAVVLQAVALCDYHNKPGPNDMGESAMENIEHRAARVQCDIAVEGVAKVLNVGSK